MQQPINGRFLVKIASSPYKHVQLSTDKQHLLAQSTGVVLDVAPDLEHIIRQALKIKDGEWIDKLPKGKQWIGKTLHWEKYAEQNAIREIDDPKKKGEKIRLALVEYKDVTSYEN